MNNTDIKKVVDWMRATDLIEISYKRGVDKIRLGFDNAPAIPEAAFPPCSLTPVTATEVGLFRPAPIGRSSGVEKGSTVKKGQTLGLIETAAGETPIKSPTAGRVVSALVENGSPVEYGQPLFFIAAHG